jgi:predicted SnoaL-like aldol condensation-catalyzing enzyme
MTTTIFLVPVLVSCLPFIAFSDQISENKAIVSSFYQEILNGKHLQKIDELFDNQATDHVGQQVTKGRAKLRQAIGAFLTAFPDINVTINRMIGEGEFVVSHSNWTATHKGPFASCRYR